MGILTYRYLYKYKVHRNEIKTIRSFCVVLGYTPIDLVSFECLFDSQDRPYRHASLAYLNCKKRGRLFEEFFEPLFLYNKEQDDMGQNRTRSFASKLVVNIKFYFGWSF